MSFMPIFLGIVWGNFLPASIILGVAAVIYIFLLLKMPKPLVKQYKDSKWGNSKKDIYGLKSELLLKINPANYIEPYDGMKMIAAVDLSQKLKTIKYDNFIELKAIRMSAEEKLGLKLDVDSFSKHVLRIIGPLNFSKKKDIAESTNMFCEKLSNHEGNIDVIEDTLLEFHDQIFRPYLEDYHTYKILIMLLLIGIMVADIIAVIWFICVGL